MAVRIGHASIDENGKANSGAAGDQNGKEVLIRVRLVSVTRTLIHTTAELYRMDQPDKVCITANATYFFKPDRP